MLLTVSVLATIFPYFLYAWVYKLPRSFSRFLTQRQLIFISKAFKFIPLLIQFYLSLNVGLNKLGMLLGIPLIVIGQVLNFAVYRVLGDEGVYYGCELKTITPKEIKGYPFNMHDPQYKGCMLTVLGSFLMYNESYSSCVTTLTWLATYFVTMMNENTIGAIDSL